MSLMVSFLPSIFLLNVFDEIWNLIESVSEGFPTYFSLQKTPISDHKDQVTNKDLYRKHQLPTTRTKKLLRIFTENANS